MAGPLSGVTAVGTRKFEIRLALLRVHLNSGTKPTFLSSTSYQTRVPAKFKHIIKRRKRKQKRFPK